MADVQKTEALTEQDAINAAHLTIKATLTTLEKALTKNSFNLRQMEAALREAKAKGRLDKMQVNAAAVASLAKNARDSLDAATMLIDRCRKGLEENQRLRDRLAQLEPLAKKDGILVSVS